ncbi:GumC family protein [Acidocella sp.]|jgi:capsular exopolysaccharide synthesis family protein|uniref:GumC family protein n=1 Tax=Acidocella sp. TaxID=50710 RepID=UPI002F40C763
MATTLPATTFAQPTETIDLGDVRSLLRRRAGTIGIFVIGATIFAIIHVLLATPQFTARGAMYLGDASAGVPPSSGNGTDLNFLSDYSNQSDVNTQIELITAGALVQHAVLETGLNAQVTPAETPPMTYWRWRFLHGGQTSAFAPGPDTLQALYATTPGAYRLVLGQDNNYTLWSRGSWFTKPQVVLHGVLGKPASGNGSQMLIEGASPNFTPVPGKAYDLKISSPAALAEGLLDGDLTVSAGGSVTQPTKIAFLQLRWYNPYQAQSFVNQMMQDYIATQLSWKTESASTTENFVTGQLANVSSALANADKNLANYQSQTGIVDVPENAQSMISQLAQYETQRTTLQLQQEALQQLDNELHHRNGPLNPYLISQVNDTVLATLTSDLSDGETKLDQLRVQYTPYAEEVKIQNAQVARMEESISTIVHNDLAAADKNLAGLNTIIDRLQGEIKQMPAESLRVISLKRSTDVLGQLYVLLMEKEEQAQVSKAATIINTRIVTPANTPLFVTSPRAVITIVFGALVGLVVGAGLVFGQRAMSGRYESEEQIRSSIRLPVYGTVPRQLKSEIGANVFGQEQRNPFSESFRLLRRSIYRNTKAGKTMVILIISASKDDGKTTVAVNLAKTLADDGKKVVLMDGDLHLSRLHEVLKLPTTVGLTDCLETDAELPIQDCPDENFKVLASGSAPLHGKQHFNEKTLAPVFARLSGQFEYVIVDSPPLPTVSDGMIFGSFADLILTVVSVSHTPKRTLNIHNELVETLDRPHGIIINEVEGQVMGEGDAYFMTETARGPKIAGWLKRS